MNPILLTLCLALSLVVRTQAQTVPSTLEIGEIFSTPVVGSAELVVDFSARDYELILYALKTEEDTSKTFAFSVSPPGASKIAFSRSFPPLSADARDQAEGKLRAEEQRIAEILRSSPLTAPKLAQVPSIGSQRQFVFGKFGGVEQDVTVTATLVASSSKAMAYLDTGNQTELEETPVTTEQIQAMLDEFSGTTYPQVTSVFGSESDVDGDGQVLFLFTPLVNQVEGIAGFYSASSAIPENHGGNGNLSDMMYISPDRKLNSYRSLLAHEFQHLISFNQHVLLRPGGDSEVSWLNEGMSHVTEDLVGDHREGGNSHNVETYLAHPERFSLTGDASLNDGIRGAAYLFLRGLIEVNGQGVLTDLSQTDQIGTANVEAVTGQTFADLYQQWVSRLFLSGTKLNADPAMNYTFSFFTETTTGLRAIRPSREDALMQGGPPLSGSLRQTAATFIRLTGSGASSKIQISADSEGDVHALVVPVPKAFRPQLVAPVDFFESLVLDETLSSNQTVGAGFTISGEVTDPSVSRLLLSFSRTDGADTLKLEAEVTGGRFSRPVVFAPSQSGTYVLSPFLFRKGPLFEGTNAFGPIVVGPNPTGDVVLPEGFFPGLKFDKPLSARQVSGEGFTLSGVVEDPTIQEVLFRFVRVVPADTLRFSATIESGRFRRPIIFTPTQAATYEFEVFGRRGGTIFDFIDGFPEFVVKRGLTDDVILPPDFFNGITFDAPFPATITAGLGVRLSGNVSGQTAPQMLVQFSPEQGSPIQFVLNIDEGEFIQDIVFTPDQAGAYTMTFFLGSGESFASIDQFGPVIIQVVPGVKTSVPVGFFTGLTLDAPFQADQFVGRSAAFSGTVADPAKTQLAVQFQSLDGGEDIPAVFFDVTNGGFSQDLSFSQAGKFQMVVFAGVEGESIFSIGNFDGIQVRTGQPDLALTAVKLDFGEVPAGGSAERSLTIHNRGTQTLSVNDVVTSSSLLTVSPRKASIAAGDSSGFLVVFQPTEEWDLSATLTVMSNDPDEGSLSVSAVARSTARIASPPTIVVSPVQLVFGEVEVGTSSDQVAILRNTGDDTLIVTDIQFSGPFEAFFPAISPLFQMASGESVSVLVTFRPTGPGGATGIMTVSNNDPDRSELGVSLSGTGVEGSEPPVSLNPRDGDGTASLGIEDLETKSLGEVKPGQEIDISIAFNQEVEASTGFGVVLTFDPEKLSVGSGKGDGVFAATITLPPQVDDSTVEFGGSFLGQSTTAAGPVAVLTFVTGKEFSGETEIELTELSIKFSGGSNDFTPGASVVLSSEVLGGGEPSTDFTGDGKVDFDDFFEFASAFGQPATGAFARFDLDGAGETIDFNDFFVFAAAFGKMTRK